MIITGNHAYAGYYDRTGQRPQSPPEIVLTEPTETGQGNFTLTHWTLKEKQLTLNKGTMRRMFYRQYETDDWQLLDPENLPTNVTNANARYCQTIYVCTRTAPSQLAMLTQKRIKDTLGSSGIEAWEWVCETLISNASFNQSAWETLYRQWANKTLGYASRSGAQNAVDPLIALDLVTDFFIELEVFTSPPTDNFEAMKGIIITLPLISWMGQDTEIIEAWD